MQNIWIDFFLFLSVMMFVGSMIIEEKEKNLFFITRSTRFGILHTIIAKMSAMLIHCVLITSLFYMISIVFLVKVQAGSILLQVFSHWQNMEKAVFP